MKVHNEITVYEVNGKDSFLKPDRIVLSIDSHWNRNELVILQFGDMVITVAEKDLTNAIRNATNWR